MARPLRAALIVMALATLLRLLAAALLPLSPDEAYYWQWSREPAFGYFDHPPVVAWLIALSTRLFGLSPLAVRLPAVLGATLLSVLLWHSARQRLDDSTALRLVLFLSLTPLFHLGGVIITPDTPLV
jgi:4-amino-4-deoxy-L-arabinose transferase-like glycosyltransferase